MFRYANAAAGIAALLLVAGCGGSGLSTLSGVVTIDDQPAPKGISLEFQSLSDGGSTAYGTTDEQGRYEAAFSFNEKGIQPGEHTVRMVGKERTEFADDGTRLAPSKNVVDRLPQSYLTEIEKITVSPGSNTHDFHLKSKR